MEVSRETDRTDCSTNILEGSLWRSVEPAESLDFVAVSVRVSDRPAQSPWFIGANSWIRDKLLVDYPQSRVDLVELELQKLDSWGNINDLGEGLCYELKSLQRDRKARTVFFLYGLGGLAFLQALHLLITDGSWRRMESRPVGCAAIFFGTPFPTKVDPGRFKKALRDCALIEGCIDNDVQLDMTDKGVQDMIDMVRRHMQHLNGPASLAFFEAQESAYRKRYGFLGNKKRVIISSDLAQLGPPSIPLCLDANHEDIGRLSGGGYDLLKNKLDGIIAVIPQEESVSSSSQPMPQPSTSTPPDGRHSVPQPATSRSLAFSGPGPGPAAPLLPPQTALNAEPVWGSDDVSVKSQCRVLWHHRPNEHFVGRETTLAKMKEHLGGKGTPPAFNNQRAYSLWGKGGVGKTQVAVKYVFDNSDAFPYILWARADTREKLLTSFSEYALLLGLIAQQPQDPAEGKDALLHWYATTKSTWLLVFDNADEIGILDEFWPRSSRGSILVTSRDGVSATSTLAEYGEQIQEMDEALAVELVKSLLGGKFESKNDEDSALVLVKRVQGLPLAIKSAVGTMMEAKCSVKKFSENWKTEDILVDSKSSHTSSPSSRYEHNLKTVWASGVSALSPSSRSLLQTLATLDPDGIPEEIFENAIGDSFRQFNFVGSRQYLKSCAALYKTSLIDKVEKPSSETALQSAPKIGVDPPHGANTSQITIHRLIQAFVRSQMRQEDWQQAFSAAVEVLNHSWPYPSQHNRTQGTFWIRQQIFFPHVQSLQVVHKAHLLNSVGDSTNTKMFVTLVNSASWYCYTRGLYQEAYPLIETARHCINANIHTGGHSWKALAIHANNTLASIGTETGDFSDALPLFEQSLQHFRDLVRVGEIKTPDVRESQCIGGIANCLSGLGRDAEAEEKYRESIALWKAETYPIYRILLARPLIAQGKLDEANEWLEMVLDERKRKFGADSTIDYKTGQAYYLLGNVRQAQGRWDEASTMHRKSLALYQATYGSRHKHTGDICYKVASHEFRSGDIDAAISRFNETLAIYRRCSDKTTTRRLIARTLFKMSIVLEEKEGADGPEVIKCRVEADKLRREVMGEEYTPGIVEADYDKIVSRWVP